MTMNNDATKSVTLQVYDYVAKRSLPPSREEIISVVPRVRKTVMNAVRESVIKGYLGVKSDEMGVPRYIALIHPVSKVPHATAPEAKEQPAPTKKKERKTGSQVDPVTEMVEPPIPRVQWEEAYHKGFNDATQHTNREAYAAGKNAAIKALLKQFVKLIEEYERG